MTRSQKLVNYLLCLVIIALGYVITVFDNDSIIAIVSYFAIALILIYTIISIKRNKGKQKK